jgi:hypothetical protein
VTYRDNSIVAGGHYLANSFFSVSTVLALSKYGTIIIATATRTRTIIIIIMCILTKQGGLAY